MSDTPFVGFTNDTLSRQPRLAEGDEITCPHCRATHVVEAGKAVPADPPLATGSEAPPLILFYSCGGKPYLAAVAGRSVISIRPDASSSGPPVEQVCDACWDGLRRLGPPTRLGKDERELTACAVCGTPTESGIYLLPAQIRRMRVMRA